jgi:hypothetical protein
MKPVDQTVFGKPNGNCQAACIASILELAIGDVPGPPKLEDSQDWLEEYNKVLFALGVQLLAVEIGKNSWNVSNGWYCILSGTSPRSTSEDSFKHAVVGRTRREGDFVFFDIVHDPHPSRSGLLDVTWVDFLVKV